MKKVNVGYLEVLFLARRIRRF